MNDKKIIAIVGGAITGKGEISNVLKKFGYEAFSGGDILREIATKQGISHERIDLTLLANRLREEQGGDVLTSEMIRRMEESGADRFVLDSFRNPHEMYPLLDLGAFVIGVETPDELRLKMSIKRARPGDPSTLEELEELKRREQNIGQGEFGQNVTGLMALADVVVQNDSTLEVFHERVESELSQRGYIEAPRTQKERDY